MQYMSVLAAITALLFPEATIAHMILEYPVPYGKATLNNSPLDASGSDFPCKQREGVYDLSQINNWNAGETQIVSFIGSATHGGGSCQFSVTKDLRPTKSSRWKVIHSVIGGCPSNVTNNLVGDSTGHGAATFDVPIPREMPNGQYAFAWTWFNREGVREMYMNCAPISIRGGGGDDGGEGDTFFRKLPDMFVANLPNTVCGTMENVDFAFPQPGDSVVTGKWAKIGTSLTGTKCTSMTTIGSGAVQQDAVQHTTNSVAKSIVPSNNHLEPASISATSALPSMQTLVASPSSCIPCTGRGSVICIGQDHFGLCDHGCALPQPLAVGMSCSHGVVVRRRS
jgi:hypothetical protein